MNSEYAAYFLTHIAIAGRKKIEVSVGTLTRHIEINKLYREYVAQYKIVVFVVVKSYIACAYMVDISLLAVYSVRAYQKLDNHVNADIFGKYLLYRAHHFLTVKALLRRSSELGMILYLRLKPVDVAAVFRYCVRPQAGIYGIAVIIVAVIACIIVHIPVPIAVIIVPVMSSVVPIVEIAVHKPNIPFVSYN